MTKTHRPWYKVLYVQVLIAIAAGVVIGHFWPELGKALKPLGDGFISLIKMMIAPVIFCTVVHGIGSMRDLRKVGRVGIVGAALLAENFARMERVGNNRGSAIPTSGAEVMETFQVSALALPVTNGVIHKLKL